MSCIKTEYKDGESQPVVVVKGEEAEADTLRPSIENIPRYIKPEEEEDEEDSKTKNTPSPASPTTNKSKTCNTHSKMSNPQTLCTFGDIAVTYRVYILDDLLAEPQEVCHDWARNLLYVGQRYRQGHAYAPIEAAHEISVVDLATAEVCGIVDLGPSYSAPHALELDHDAVYLSARVDEGMVWVDAESRCVTNFADRSQIASTTASSSSGSGSSSSRHSRHGHHSSSSRHSHGSSSSGSSSSSSSSNNNFIAEVDLRSGKIRQRVMVPDSEQQDPKLGFVTFSSPAIRFASRQSSDGMPVVAVEEDPVVAAIRHRFGVKTIYITSRNVMLV
ncbi:hypothetical protein PG985_014900 [Apiospora marii]|uniref:SMP-30/Gluconolactonase/LRE-like region domain-containing protein n=1 Tax=Apiospora marii TaxID=335849 RepID=A0ABR1RJB9_9PEZI